MLEVSDSDSEGSLDRIKPHVAGGEDSSPLPAGSAVGGRKSKLFDAETYQKALDSANNHFS